MKGISLTIETIVVLILAVTVMSVLLLFFSNQFGKGQDTTTRLQKQNDLCFKYLQLNPRCDQNGHDKIKNKLGDLPKEISKKACEPSDGRGYASCMPGLTSDTVFACIKECCRSICRQD